MPIGLIRLLLCKKCSKPILIRVQNSTIGVVIMDISLKIGKNPFHPIMSLYMIFYMYNNSLYYHPIIDDVELC